jgi:hypothetical protein
VRLFVMATMTTWLAGGLVVRLVSLAAILIALAAVWGLYGISTDAANL